MTDQQWTSHDKLRLTNRNSIRFEEPFVVVGNDTADVLAQRSFETQELALPIATSLHQPVAYPERATGQRG